MKNLKKFIFLLAFLPVVLIANDYESNISMHGGGGHAGGGMRNDRGDVREGEFRGNYQHRDGYYGGYGGYGSYGGYAPAAYPAYGYPVGGYLPPQDAFPDDSQEDSIYRANQHRYNR